MNAVLMDTKILVIDDNEQDQKIILRYLQKSGYRIVVTADSGEKGLEQAGKESPELILLDTLLPGIDGFETCRRLKEYRAGFKIIMMTGRVDAVDADKASRMGADDYCVKTSDCAAILEAVFRIQAKASDAAVHPAVRSEAVSVQSTAALPSGPITTEWGLDKTNQAIKALYRELEKKNQELKELDNLKSEFVSTVSHELRTPLTIIKGAISQVLDGIYGEISIQQREKLAMALKGTNLLRRIIDDLLDIAKLEAKKVKLNTTFFYLDDAVREVCQSFLAMANQKGLDLRMNLPQDKVTFKADRDRIVQILTNLLGNAVKFTEKGQIEIAVQDFPDHVSVTVTDTGRGISEQDQLKVFDRFQQFGKSFAPGQEGTGLGLSITKNLVELHRGVISVKSELGKGTTFLLNLPKET